jgi:nicotinamidase-related amidase
MNIASEEVSKYFGEDLALQYSGKGFANSVGFGLRPAVLVVDMANAFTDPSYRLGSSMDGTVEVIANLLGVARSNRVPVLYTTTAFGNPPEEIGMAALKVPSLGELRSGTRAVEIDQRLAPQDGEFVLVKKYWSSFMMTNLLPILVYQQIDTLIITGNSASGCVRAAATDALCYGFRPIVPMEAVADRSDGPYRSNLFDINAKFADVMPVSAVIEYLESVHVA